MICICFISFPNISGANECLHCVFCLLLLWLLIFLIPFHSKDQFGKCSANLLWGRNGKYRGMRKELALKCSGMDPFERGLVWHFYHSTIFLLMGKKLSRKSSKSQLWNLSVGKKCAYICCPIASRISLIHLTSPAFVSFLYSSFLIL